MDGILFSNGSRVVARRSGACLPTVPRSTGSHRLGATRCPIGAGSSRILFFAGVDGMPAGPVVSAPIQRLFISMDASVVEWLQPGLGERIAQEREDHENFTPPAPSGARRLRRLDLCRRLPQETGAAPTAPTATGSYRARADRFHHGDAQLDKPGGGSVLAWRTTDATEISIDGIGTVNAYGTQNVSPPNRPRTISSPGVPVVPRTRLRA